MNQKQLEDYLWGSADILRGIIDAADFKQYIFLYEHAKVRGLSPCS